MRLSVARPLTIAACVAPLLFVHASTLTGQAAPPAASAASNAAADVTLLDAGAAPRRVLRYTFTKGASESLSMRQQMGMAIEVNGMAMPSQPIPATLMTLKLDVADVTASGAADVRAEIVQVDVDTVGANPMLLAPLRAALAPMQGVVVSYRVAPNGQVEQVSLSENAPVGTPVAQALGSTEQLSVAFPAEPVGVGARWKAMRTVQQNGVTIQQTMEYTVASLAADSVVLDLAVVQQAAEQTFAVPGAPPGTEATLRSLDGRGTSSVVIHFARVQPQLTMTLKAVMAMDLTVGAESATMNQTMTMDLKTVSSPR
jgi:hypothetical protein